MAKNTTSTSTSNTETADTTVVTDGAATAPAAGTVAEAGAATDDRFKLITHPTTKQRVKRVDFIRERWGQGASRGQITKELNEPGVSDKKVPYQIVFAATKGQPGGPPKAPAEGAAQTPAAEGMIPPQS